MKKMINKAGKKVNEVYCKAKFKVKHVIDELNKPENTALKATVITGAIGAVAAVPKIVSVTNDLRTKRRLEKVERDKKRYIYDRSSGCYIPLKRELTGDELRYVDLNRKYHTKSLIEVLNELNVIR